MLPWTNFIVLFQLWELYMFVASGDDGPAYWNKFTDVSRDEMTEEQRLLYHLLRTYDKSSRPVFKASTPVVIRLGITLTQILDVDEKNQILTTNIWLDQEWIDEKMVWNNITEFAHIKKLRIPCDLLWLPDIVLYNSVDNHNKGYMKSLAFVDSDGNIFWPPIVKFRSSCKMDITYFPFDDQVCSLKLGSWAYDGYQVDITNRSLDIDITRYVDNGEWTLIGTKAVRRVVRYPCCPEPFPDVTFYVHIRRRVLYYAFNVIIPCALLSTLTLTGFMLPPDSGEKVTLGLTVLLAFSVFMLLIAENMPATSEYIPLIGIYLTVIMAMSGMSVVCSVLVLNIHHRGVLSRSPPRALKCLARAFARLFCMKVQLDDTTNASNYRTTVTYTPANFTCKSNDNESLLYNDIQGQTPLHMDIQDTDTLNDVMNQNMPQTVPGKSKFDIEILTYFKQMMTNHEQSLLEKQIVLEWQEIARVMDKVFFWLFLLITVLSTIIILVISPMTKEINLEEIHHSY